MLSITLDKNFTNGWYSAISGDCSVSVENNILKISGTTGTGMKVFYVPVKFGQLVVVDVLARKINGSNARVSIDERKSDGSVINTQYTETDSVNWERIRFKFIVSSPDASYVSINFGKWSSMSATEQHFKDPIIMLEGGIGTIPMVAFGVIRLLKSNPSAPEILTTYKNFGIVNVVRLDSTSLKIFIDSKFSYYVKPLIVASGRSESFAIPMVGNFNDIESSFLLKFSNGTSFINFDTTPVDLYATLLVYG